MLRTSIQVQHMPFNAANPRTVETTDVVIIGGGVIGCAIAYFLRQQRVNVVLLERGEIGGQASGASAGLLAPLGPLSGPGLFADLVLAGFARLVELVPELEAVSGIQVGFEQTGALRVVRNPKRIAHLQKRMEKWQPLGLHMYWLNGDEARRREPLLTPDVCAAVYAPEESQISASHLVQAYARAAQGIGADIRPQQEVHSLLKHGTRVAGVQTKQGASICCNFVVLASGAWAAQCVEEFDVALPVSPLHGQLLSLPQPPRPLQHIIFGDAAYIVPRGNSILVGATKEERGFDQTITEQGTDWLYTTGTQLVPELAGSSIQRTWSGLRPKTPDNHPLIDFLPSWKNVLVAAGHNSVGIILSAITGQCVAEMTTTGKTPSIVQPFSLARFMK